MAIQLTNPLHAVWRYMRGDDITEANARALSLAQAARAAGGASPPSVAAETPLVPPIDRRRM